MAATVTSTDSWIRYVVWMTLRQFRFDIYFKSFFLLDTFYVNDLFQQKYVKLVRLSGIPAWCFFDSKTWSFGQ